MAVGYLVVRVLWWFSVMERLKIRRARLRRRLIRSQHNPYGSKPDPENR
ncbi:hypothetical protein [Thioalkalivibrio sp.]|nr:hypothetical protein [Thioalkalivibrio sp.]